VNLIVLGLDGEGKVDYVNPYFLTLAGYTRDEVVGRDWFEFIPKTQRESMRGVFRELLERELHPHYENPIVTKAGVERMIAWHNTALRDEQGRPTGTLSIGADITDRKRSEEIIRHLTLAVEQSPAGVVITDTAGTIQYVNRKFTELTGFSAAEALGKNPRIFKSGNTSTEVYRELWGKITAGEEWRGVMQNRRKDGSLWWNAATVSPMRDVDGNVTHFLAIQQDVTQQRQLEDQLRQAQKMEAVGRLAGGVAHDFNNLLTVISSYSELLLDDLPAADQARRDDLGQITKAAADASALTRQLLAFSRQQVLEAKVLDLNAIVSGAGKMLQRVIGEDITLALVLAPKLGWVKADPGQVEQVIMNLAVNARDAMPDGGKLTIETTNTELDAGYIGEHGPVAPGSYVRLVVSDTGVGMDDETRRRIFEPFFTTKEQGKGTGLGLATVYGIVKQSGGFVWVYSEPGKGAAFKIYLPQVVQSEDVERGAETLPPPAKGTETVLLAEDAASVRAVTRQILERQGYTVLEAPSGRAAVDIAAKRRGGIHLLLTDVVMPEMSGRQLADQLAELRPEIKVLFISGYTDDSVVRHGVLEAGVAYLQKPFTPDSLARKVREVLDRER
jgi:PAS domain S-box-containing protein